MPSVVMLTTLEVFVVRNKNNKAVLDMVRKYELNPADMLPAKGGNNHPFEDIYDALSYLVVGHRRPYKTIITTAK